jgi:hypothetical protein
VAKTCGGAGPPIASLIALAVVVVLAVRNVGTLLGGPPGHYLAWAALTTYVVIGFAALSIPSRS